MKLGIVLLVVVTIFIYKAFAHSENMPKQLIHIDASINNQIHRLSLLEKAINVVFIAYSVSNIQTLPELGLFQLGFHVFLNNISFFVSEFITRGLETASKRYPYVQKTAVEIAKASGVSENSRVYISKDTTMNAYTNSVLAKFPSIVLHQGLVDNASYNIAHEIGHIKNRDILHMHKILLLGNIAWDMLSMLHDHRAETHASLSLSKLEK